MNIPQELNFRATLFGDGAKGSYIQCYRNEQYGINCTVTAETRHAAPVQVFTMDALPESEWDSFKAISEDAAVLDLPEPDPYEEPPPQPGPFDHLWPSSDPRAQEMDDLDAEEDVPF